jgi:hypothetical protein
MTSALALLLVTPTQALPQKQGTSKTQKRRAPAPVKPAPPPPDLRAEAAQVAEQLKLITRFLYVYGRVSTGLETADEQAKRGEANQTVLAQIQRNKASVVLNINGIRAGLEKLQQSFHANSRLQLQYLKLLSASETAAKAEQLAAANRFDEAGRTLLAVAERLADLIAEVR